MGIGIERPRRLLVPFCCGDLDVQGTGVQVLSLGAAGRDDCIQYADQILHDELLSPIVDIVTLLLDRHAAGGVLRIDHDYSVCKIRTLTSVAT